MNSVALGVYVLVKEFAMQAEPDTLIKPIDLCHIGDEFDVKPSLEKLCFDGLLEQKTPGEFTRLEIGLQ